MAVTKPVLENVRQKVANHLKIKRIKFCTATFRILDKSRKPFWQKYCSKWSSADLTHIKMRCLGAPFEMSAAQVVQFILQQGQILCVVHSLQTDVLVLKVNE